MPQGSQIEIKILNLEETLIDLMDYGFNLDVFPNQASILKSSNPDNIPFYYNEDYYNIDKFSGNNFVSTELLGTMRGQNLARLSISPVSYNPVTNQIKVVTKAEVKVIFKNIDISSDTENRKKYYSHEFESLFKSFVNYTPLEEKDVITTYPVKYVIISAPQFQTVLQPFVEWKRKKGF